jgi:hypothetical protein
VSKTILRIPCLALDLSPAVFEQLLDKTDAFGDEAPDDRLRAPHRRL